MDHNRTYVAIDLKSFYASVECMERGLDPLKTHLVVADDSRTDKTICLAVSPSLKAYGVPGRPRLFEVKQIVNRINREHPEELPNEYIKIAWKEGAERAACDYIAGMTDDFFKKQYDKAKNMIYLNRK